MSLTELRQVPFAVPDIDESDIADVSEALRSGWLTTGKVNAEFENELATYLDTSFVATTSSCTAALECSIASLGLPAASPIAAPSWTFVSTVTSILHCGHVPVLVDTRHDDLNLSTDAVRRAIDDGARAVIVVHFAGVPVQADVYDLCAERGVPLIEDSAHALGTTLPRDRPLWSSCFSFYATKNLTTGEGGAVSTPHEAVDLFVRKYRLHGLSADAWRRYAPGGRPTYDVEMPGIKGNLPDLLAALGRSQLRRFDALQARRRELVQRYHDRLAEIGVSPLPATIDPRSANHLMVIRLDAGTDRDAIVADMAAAGVGTSIHFRPVHRFEAIAKLCDLSAPLTVAEELADRVLSLPLHPQLTDDDVDHVVDSFRSALGT